MKREEEKGEEGNMRKEIDAYVPRSWEGKSDG